MFKSKPFIFILPAFMLGIFVGKVFLVPWKVSMAFALICSFLFVIFYIKNILNFKKELVLVILTFFSLGALLIYPSLNPKIKENNIVNFVTKGKTFLKVKGVINSVIKRSDVSETFIVDVTGVLKDDQWQTSSGKVRIKLKGKTNYKRNDNIAFYGSFSRPQNFGNVDEFDYSLWLKFQEVLVTAYIDTDDKIILVKEGKGFNHYIDEKRNDLSLYIEGKEFKNKNIIKALITGERGYFSNDEYLVFQKTGTSHLLAVSGLHIGLVSIFSFMILMNIFKRFPALMLNYNVRKLSIFLSLVPAFLYATLAGLPVTAMRAFLMIALTVFILLIERPKNKFNMLSLVAFVMLLFNPSYLWSVAFQLSFMAVFGIFLLVPHLEERFIKEDDELIKDKFAIYKKNIKTLVFITISATVFTMPLAAYHFHLISFSSFFVNIFAVPMVTLIIVPLLLLSTSFFFIIKPVAFVLFYIGDFFTTVLLYFLELFDSIPFSYMYVVKPNLFVLLLIYLVLIFACLIKYKPKFKHGVMACVTVLFVNYGIFFFFEYVLSRDLEITYISVGQGESVLIEFPKHGFGKRKRMLIDSGGFHSLTFDTGRDIIAPYLWHRKITKIDYLLLTHSQLDHMGGFSFLAEIFKPDFFWYNGRDKDRLENLFQILENKNTKIEIKNSGSDDITVGNVNIDFLHPAEKSRLNINESSLVVKLSYGESKFLFTGDVGKNGGERSLMVDDIESSILKVAHHGSKYSTSDEFLDRVKPCIAIISAGYNNSFSFPNLEVLERLNKRNVPYLVTSKDGMIKAYATENYVRIITELTKKSKSCIM